MNFQKKTEILFGIHPVLESLKARRRKISEIYLAKDKRSQRLDDIAAIAESFNIPIKIFSSPQLTAVTAGDGHQGVAAKVSFYPTVEVKDILQTAGGEGTPPFLLLADSIEDTQNLGALIRTALCAGVHGIIIPKDRAAPPTPAVSKASAGAMEHILLAQVTNMVNAIGELKENGVWIAGMDGKAEKSVFEAELSGALGIVIGGEEKGVRPLVKRHCDFLMAIPQSGQIDSLNASAAGAVVMYEAFRQRNIFSHSGKKFL
jgi:23S rRNA (guanosine2251-2'-O)-methyltransferase